MTVEEHARVDEKFARIHYRKRFWIGIGSLVVVAFLVLAVSVGFFIAGLNLRDERGHCISVGLSHFAQGISATLDKQIGADRTLPLTEVDRAARELRACGK